MPQFELHNFLPQMAWLGLLFAVLYFGVVRLTLPKVGRIVEGREERVRSDIASAAQAKEKADQVGAAYQFALAKAHEQARDMLKTAGADARAKTEAQLAKSGEALEKSQAAASEELAAARTKALSQIESLSADTAADIVERLTGNRPTAAAANAAVKSAAA
jgi:F-type H+-transporting ATPase subunit b